MERGDVLFAPVNDRLSDFEPLLGSFVTQDLGQWYRDSTYTRSEVKHSAPRYKPANSTKKSLPALLIPTEVAGTHKCANRRWWIGNARRRGLASLFWHMAIPERN